MEEHSWPTAIDHKEFQEFKLKNTINIIKAVVPELDWLVAEMEKNGGWLPFQGWKIGELNFVDFITKKFSIENWAEFYLKEKQVRAMSARLFLDPDELAAAENNPEEAIEFLKMAATGLLNENDFDTLEFDPSLFLEMNDEEQKEAIKYTLVMYVMFLVSVPNVLSLMVNGRTIFSLVQDAIDGDDNALCSAVRIDKTILFLPFVRDKLMAAQFGNQGAFLEKLGNSIKKPILGQKIRYRTLWVALALLDDEGLLDLPHEKLLDICEELGVYGKSHGVEDVGHFSKRLQDYKKRNWN